ncbi:MAG TPA: ABC transporter substrate-binding protein [Tianweitania sediminis]|jgi:NitT/TauT family transport system substrate-binding protein|nr:ABC transporter substrate-binding protein [Tianweitania sediminis]
MRISLLGIALVASAVSFGLPASAQEPKPISISYQPAIYGLGIEIATQQGWWKEIGLEPTFTMFPSGAPQIAAAAAGAWDVGLLGAPPAVLGAVRMQLKTIALATEEGNANVVLARADEVEAIKADPSSLKGKPFLVSTNSTGEYASWACLSKLGLNRKDMQFINLAPAQIVSAFSNGEGALAGTFTPFVYTIQQQTGAKVLCSAADADKFLMSVIVTRPDYADENKEAVAKFLATYLRAIAWIKGNEDKALEALQAFYSKNGVVIDVEYMRQEMTKDRQQFTLDKQIETFARSDNASTLDQAFDDFMGYLTETGTIPEKLDPKTFITNEYLQMIDSDPALKAWAMNQ